MPVQFRNFKPTNSSTDESRESLLFVLARRLGFEKFTLPDERDERSRLKRRELVKKLVRSHSVVIGHP